MDHGLGTVLVKVLRPISICNAEEGMAKVRKKIALAR
jgi:hypothetical protein